jgi:hypothetical protein
MRLRRSDNVVETLCRHLSDVDSRQYSSGIDDEQISMAVKVSCHYEDCLGAVFDHILISHEVVVTIINLAVKMSFGELAQTSCMTSSKGSLKME